MNADFSKPYDPKTTEPEIYQKWLDSGYFNPDNLPVNKNSRLKIKNYVVYMPLPNVTGTLHMGHALDNTGSDILIRYHRMKGFRTLWLPGTDHAGIATQYKVEKELKKEGISRFDLGREKFIERVWKWKEEYGGIITEQLKRLGVSADWSRSRFTLDKSYARDVISAFVHYYEKGWIYRGFRTVNWCPRCGTSLSELELEHKEEKSFLWYIKYPLSDGSGSVTVATTRPETMLGDTAVAVNPKDKRYSSIVGKKIRLPLSDREIPIVADLKIDLNFGTGALKVTPAHDITDFEIGQRHKLETISVIDERGKMNAKAGEYAGMKTDEARILIVQKLKYSGFLEKEEPYMHNVSTCERCGHVIEPIPSTQWFLKMDKLAEKALKAVKSKETKIQPKNFQKVYLDWLLNIRDWTISRQLWWGHQLPVYFCKQEEVSNEESQMSIGVKESKASDINSKFEIQSSKFIVSAEKPKTCPFCKHCEMIQSTDVLDTWFSSALWPFAGLSDDDKKKYYPGNFVSNAREILNLWDTRMIFSGIEFMGEVPFKDVFIHGTILTKDGKRMSKSLGTGIDPLNYINQYGADATRFAVIWQANGQDIRWDEAAVMAGRKFSNKIWNASRFVLEQISNSKSENKSSKLIPETAADEEIIGKLTKIKKQTEALIEQFEFAKALQGLYDFFWHDFCDKYLEESKKQLTDEKNKESTLKILNAVLLESLKIIHPFLPFVTEAIYQNINKKGGILMVSEW
ncbi:valine--tRNA ligase [Patescibacteria group bacterium]|nr:valine--tRNA ligase [Patescibacteria group bacterium]